MKLNNNLKIMGLGLVMLSSSACGSFDGRTDGGADLASASAPGPAMAAARADAGDPPVQLGVPYDIEGTRYVPSDVPDYDDVGYASWVGGEQAGQLTSLGEAFRPDAVSAAHKTLPIPSYVEVTALDTGRTILVRVNDRGPRDNGRLIDLSAGAADQLGIQRDGVSAVRVRRVNPPEAERAALRAGGRIPERLPTPEALLSVLRNKANGLPPASSISSAAVSAPRPVAETEIREEATPGGDRFIVEGAGAARTAAPSKPAATTKATASKPAPEKNAPALGSGYIVQVSAFSSEARANAVAKATGGKVVKSGSVWRVRMGPYKDEAAAQKALNDARAKGYRDARIMRDK